MLGLMYHMKFYTLVPYQMNRAGTELGFFVGKIPTYTYSSKTASHGFTIILFGSM